MCNGYCCALSTCDSFELALIGVGYSVGATDLNLFMLWANRRRAYTMYSSNILYTSCSVLTQKIRTRSGCNWVLITAVGAQVSAIGTLFALHSADAGFAGTQSRHLLTVIPDCTERVTVTRGTSTLLIYDNAPEIPESRFATITFQTSHTWFAGTLTVAGATGFTVRAVLVTLTGAWASCKANSLGSSYVIKTTAIDGLAAMLFWNRWWDCILAGAEQDNMKVLFNLASCQLQCTFIVVGYPIRPTDRRPRDTLAGQSTITRAVFRVLVPHPSVLPAFLLLALVIVAGAGSSGATFVFTWTLFNHLNFPFLLTGSRL